MLSLYSSRYTINDYNRMLKAVRIALDNLEHCGQTDCRECANRLVCEDLARLTVYCERKIHEIETNS